MLFAPVAPVQAPQRCITGSNSVNGDAKIRSADGIIGLQSHPVEEGKKKAMKNGDRNKGEKASKAAAASKAGLVPVLRCFEGKRR